MRVIFANLLKLQFVLGHLRHFCKTIKTMPILRISLIVLKYNSGLGFRRVFFFFLGVGGTRLKMLKLLFSPSPVKPFSNSPNEGGGGSQEIHHKQKEGKIVLKKMLNNLDFGHTTNFLTGL